MNAVLWLAVGAVGLLAVYVLAILALCLTAIAVMLCDRRNRCPDCAVAPGVLHRPGCLFHPDRAGR